MNLLLALTLSGSVLTLLLLGLRYSVLRRMPSTVYYYAWLLVLLRFALPLPGLIPAAVETKHPEPTAHRETSIREQSEPLPGIFLPYAVPDQAPYVPSQLQEPAKSVGAAEAAEQRESPAAHSPVHSFNLRAPQLWLFVWALGTALSLGLTVFTYLRFTIHLRHELHRPDRFTCEVYASIPGRKPRLSQAATMRTPLMYGVFMPRIVLPEHPYEEEQLVNILRHELMHYRRFDTLYKWLAVIVLSAHWFNPLSWMIRKELNRACELSCDEMLLRNMTHSEKRSYGNTLLSMAATSALPAGVVATTFSTEKRNLKERLVQIMNYKKSGARILAAVLALVLLTGCGMAAGPKPQTDASVPDSDPAEGVTRVSTVDEFLAAIRPNATIELTAGDYDLSTASNYGKESDNPNYSWESVWGEKDEINAELVIRGVEGLTIRGVGMDKTTLAAVPRYANVIRFQSCPDLTVENLTAGHTTEPGFCSGGVLRLEACSDASVVACGLYGCGTIGVDAVDAIGLKVTDCKIYECSYEAVNLHTCRNVRIENCEIYRHGVREGQGSAVSIFAATYSDGVVIHGNRVYENNAQYLVQFNYTKNAVFLSNDVHDNRFNTSVFQFEQYGAMVDGCAFTDNGKIIEWVRSSGVYANDTTGKLLDAGDFEAMKLREIEPDTAVTPATVAAAAEVRPGESIVVTTVDEFLAAIGPDRTIMLDGELFDLSTAANYGSVGGEYYFWQESYDGPQLVIQNANGLSIGAVDADNTATTLAAIPRYANVLAFRDCENLHLFGFTAGHTKEPGSCSGGVLLFQNCHKITVDQMRLYGCGILGLQTSQCDDLLVKQTEIYECSQGAGQFFQTDGITFEDCNIHDVPNPALIFNECGDKTWNGETLTNLNGAFDISESGELTEHVVSRDESPEYTGSVEDLGNPFADEPSAVYAEDTPQARFASFVQKAIADGDWEALADRMAFPVQFFLDGYSVVIHDREEFLSSVDIHTGNSPFTPRVCERFANASLEEFGSCVFGTTCLDHLIAFGCYGDSVTEDNLFINAISTTTPLWPGRAYAQAVPPTPQP